MTSAPAAVGAPFFAAAVLSSTTVIFAFGRTATTTDSLMRTVIGVTGPQLVEGLQLLPRIDRVQQAFGRPQRHGPPERIERVPPSRDDRHIARAGLRILRQRHGRQDRHAAAAHEE